MVSLRNRYECSAKPSLNPRRQQTTMYVCAQRPSNEDPKVKNHYSSPMTVAKKARRNNRKKWICQKNKLWVQIFLIWNKQTRINENKSSKWKRKIMETVQTSFRHHQHMVQTSLRQHPKIIQISLKHHADMIQTLFRQQQNDDSI